MPLIIRKAERGDLPFIHDLVRELAIFEKEEKEFTATLTMYENDFKENIFQSIVAELNGEIVGMVLFYLTYSTWKGKMLYLEDFVVKEKSRGQGIGKALFEAFIEEAKNQNCQLAKWQVLDWNEPAIQFYKQNNAILEKNWWNCKVFFNKNKDFI
ncbi:MAG: GNAT family N-acetyltransferase [Bacteroidetes bacterium]|nr:GNAT family N-acetyltransferase [Bacteroidota bacterium]